MEQKHTPEPWIADGTLVYKLNDSGYNQFSAFVQDAHTSKAELEANARRIVACVNACEGLSTDELERFGLASAFGTELLKIENQRDQLLAALEAIKHSMQQGRIIGNDYRSEMKLSEKLADAAIATIKDNNDR